MRLNAKTKIIGERVILIPYEAKHVPRYHQWMQSVELQQLTASEPLTLQQEYNMQRSWREDDNKCTFLLLNRDLYESGPKSEVNEILSLIGDTNLFLRQEEIDNNGGSGQTTIIVAEAEIMIAERSARGKRFGWEAMLLMFSWALANLPTLAKFEAKIGTDNTNSLSMFNKMLFMETSRSAVFQEVTLERPITAQWRQWLSEQVKLNSQPYD